MRKQCGDCVGFDRVPSPLYGNTSCGEISAGANDEACALFRPKEVSVRYAEDMTPAELDERKARKMREEADDLRRYRARLQALKDRIDLFGEQNLTEEERALVEKHDLFFHPREG